MRDPGRARAQEWWKGSFVSSVAMTARPAGPTLSCRIFPPFVLYRFAALVSVRQHDQEPEGTELLGRPTGIPPHRLRTGRGWQAGSRWISRCLYFFLVNLEP